MSIKCPTASWGDVVILNGIRGIVGDEWSAYDPTGEHKGWHLIHLEGGGKKWASPDSLERQSAEFIGMPNEDHAPEFMNPLTLWQQIPHEYNEYLTHDMDSGCMYCGLHYGDQVHIKDPSEPPNPFIRYV